MTKEQIRKEINELKKDSSYCVDKNLIAVDMAIQERISRLVKKYNRI